MSISSPLAPTNGQPAPPRWGGPWNVAQLRGWRNTPNLPTNIVPTNIAGLKLSWKFPMDMKISPLTINIMLESNPLKPTMLVGDWAQGWKPHRVYIYIYIHTHTPIYIGLFTSIYTYIYIYIIHMYVYIYIYIPTCLAQKNLSPASVY